MVPFSSRRISEIFSPPFCLPRRFSTRARFVLGLGHEAPLRSRRPSPAREVHRLVARRSRAEHQALGQRVRAQPVGAVDRDTGRLARGIEPRQLGRAVDVRIDAAHHVVDDRPDRDRLVVTGSTPT